MPPLLLRRSKSLLNAQQHLVEIQRFVDGVMGSSLLGCLSDFIAVSDVQMNTRVEIRDACEEAKEGGRRQRKRGEIPLPPGEDK